MRGMSTAAPLPNDINALKRMVAERDAIGNALARAGFNVTHAARELEMSRMTLYRLMEKHGIASEAATAAAARFSALEGR